jgi:hypothetical protein
MGFCFLAVEEKSSMIIGAVNRKKEEVRRTINRTLNVAYLFCWRVRKRKYIFFQDGSQIKRQKNISHPVWLHTCRCSYTGAALSLHLNIFLACSFVLSL